MIEMYLAVVFVSRVEDITQALRGMKVSHDSTLSPNMKVYEQM